MFEGTESLASLLDAVKVLPVGRRNFDLRFSDGDADLFIWAGFGKEHADFVNAFAGEMAGLVNRTTALVGDSTGLMRDGVDLVSWDVSFVDEAVTAFPVGEAGLGAVAGGLHLTAGDFVKAWAVALPGETEGLLILLGPVDLGVVCPVDVGVVCPIFLAVELGEGVFWSLLLLRFTDGCTIFSWSGL